MDTQVPLTVPELLADLRGRYLRALDLLERSLGEQDVASVLDLDSVRLLEITGELTTRMESGEPHPRGIDFGATPRVAQLVNHLVVNQSSVGNR
ncbi:hypothetical protein ABZ816_24425 [Actinosynnema sp. NPDC047251]|uniref:hypothetical protein n=1 Tax=Saccharothrix espanaensis TaxID=103731 RepID=UPI0002E07F12|nr:hypothetical protein [Saccharothrix espanaensis]